MLGKSDATPMIAVKDLDRARKFYEDTLGLKEVDDFGEGFMLKTRRHQIQRLQVRVRRDQQGHCPELRRRRH